MSEIYFQILLSWKLFGLFRARRRCWKNMVWGEEKWSKILNFIFSIRWWWVEGGQATKMKSWGWYGVIEKVTRFFIFHVNVTAELAAHSHCLPSSFILYLASNYNTSTKMSWCEALSELHLFQFCCASYNVVTKNEQICKNILFISCLIKQKFFFHYVAEFFLPSRFTDVISEACLNSSSFSMLAATNETSFTDFFFLLPHFLLSFNSPSSATLANAMSVFKVKIQMSKMWSEEGW